MEDDKKETPMTSDSVYTQKGGELKLKTDPTRELTLQRRLSIEGIRPPSSAATQFTLPISPELEVIEAKGITANISWEQDVEGIENCQYEVCWWSDETDMKFAYTNSKNYKITKMKEGQTYSAKVTLKSANGSNASLASNTVYFDTAPAPPVDLQVDNFLSSPDNAIIVSFKDINKGRKVTHKVQAEAMNEGAQRNVKQTATRKALVDGLQPGVTYSISVKTMDGDEESEIAYFDTPIMTYPGIPKEVRLAHENGILTFTWERLAITPLHYEVHWKANGVVSVSTVNEERFVLDDTKLSTIYRFKVAAVNKAGRGSFSEEKTYQTNPAPPCNVSVQRNIVSPTSSFVVNYDDTDILVKTYEIFATNLDGQVVSHAESNTHTAVLNGLHAGRPHYVYVMAVYGDQKSEKVYCTRNMSV